MKRCWVLALGLCAGQAHAAPPTTAVSTLTLSCAVAYMPARSTWVREVQIEWDRKTIRALRIDGVTPYSFSVHADGLVTAIDNERIQLDWRQRVWRSDFRGLATGQGRCESSGA